MERELVMVIQHLSVKGVITNLLATPMYSQPYLIQPFIYRITIQSFSSQQSLNCFTQKKSSSELICSRVKCSRISLLCTSYVIRDTSTRWWFFFFKGYLIKSSSSSKEELLQLQQQKRDCDSVSYYFIQCPTFPTQKIQLITYTDYAI